nr:BrnA antitoxin family protein [Georgfuchsia toluolica]
MTKGKVRLPGQRDPQKQPTKVAVTVRYSPEVVEYFRATGEGRQTRMNDAGTYEAAPRGVIHRHCSAEFLP